MSLQTLMLLIFSTLLWHLLLIVGLCVSANAFVLQIAMRSFLCSIRFGSYLSLHSFRRWTRISCSLNLVCCEIEIVSWLELFGLLKNIFCCFRSMMVIYAPWIIYLLRWVSGFSLWSAFELDGS
ncbi:hypothetical protein ES332_D09G080300v1 [Gossypium tomentosum]|uniref:Uncharacterized protein n=1 Tax=Gossypium tomentosum TaxID=34277 RepID=A0A5D2JFF3_GOSTO|nr:hypothetical protein ES332_D09G080300v1 [Gossypium tomentosum]